MKYQKKQSVLEDFSAGTVWIIFPTSKNIRELNN